MKLETFFAKFERFADAPDAVAKMRELVLNLAVQGKLVAQDPNDEPVEVNGGRHDELASQARFEIPERWKWTQLSDLAEINGGFAFKSTAYSEKGTRVVRISDFDEFGFKEHKVVRHPFTPELQKFMLGGENILMAMPGGTVGKSYLVRSLPEPIVVNQRVATIKVSARANPCYIDIVIRSEMTQEVIRKVKNSTNDNISMVDIKAFAVPFPPLAEQKRIVAKVDELMALCDRLEAQQQERETRHAALARASLARFADAPTPANLTFLFHKSYTIPPADLRKSILTLAVQGKLVPQDPNEEPAITDLGEIEAEKVALIQARKLRPNRVTEISQTRALQYEVPDSWRWFRLSDVAFFQEGPGIRNWQFRTQGIKLLNVQNIVDGRLVLENTDRYISTEEFESTYRHFAVEPGDILFASSGASWGKTAWFEDPGYTVMLNTSMVRLKFYSKRCDDAFLLLFLRTEFFKTQMEIQLVGIQPNFGSTHLGRTCIPLPPLAEQRRVVARVDQDVAANPIA